MRYSSWRLLGVWDAEGPNPVHKLGEKLLSACERGCCICQERCWPSALAVSTVSAVASQAGSKWSNRKKPEVDHSVGTASRTERGNRWSCERG